MRPNRVHDRWIAGEAATCGWLSIGSSYGAEIAGHAGFDAVLVDLQHGMTGTESAIAMLQAISATPATPFVRVPRLDSAAIMHAFDMGAYGVICPMIDTAEQAAALVEATRYPPSGNRSFGPARGLLYGGADYFANADKSLVRLAMIETAAGLAALDSILAVDGLDGVFVGPNDLGLALGAGPAGEPTDERVKAAITHCAVTARKAGKHAGIFCPSGAAASGRAAEGFDFLVPNSDTNLLRGAYATELRACVPTK